MCVKRVCSLRLTYTGVHVTGGHFCMMSEEPKDEQTARLLKRHNEENGDSAENTKRIKADEEHAEDEKKFPKKKVVLLLAYSGKGYYGMQVHGEAGHLSSSFSSCSR